MNEKFIQNLVGKLERKSHLNPPVDVRIIEEQGVNVVVV
jgi:hypothetical protein